MRKFVIPRVSAKVSIAKNYRTYLAKLMSRGTYSKFNFFADILSGLKAQEDSNTKTFSIQIKDGHYLMKYSPDMVEQLDEYGAGIVICHELGHAALSHMGRMILYADMYSHDKKKQVAAMSVVHLAADYALNSWLIDVCGIFSLKDLKTRVGTPKEDSDYEGTPMGTYAGIHPSDVNLPPRKSLEWYVNALSNRITDQDWDVDNLFNPGGDGGEGNPGQGDGDDAAAGGSLARAVEKMTQDQMDELIEAAGLDPEGDIDNLLGDTDSDSGDGEGMSPAELADQLSREFKRMMAQAKEAQKSRGTMPGGMTDWLEEIFRPPAVDWKQELKKYTKTAAPRGVKSTLGRPRRRHISIPGVEVCDYPGKRKNKAYNIVFAIDTSASVSSSEIQEIFSELKAIMDMSTETRITVVECDTQIHKVYELGKTLDVKVSGRGGTDFNPVFKWVCGKADFEGTKCEKVPDLLIYATDGECSLPEQEVRIPPNKVLWLLSSRGSLPCENTYWGKRTTEVSGYGDYGRFVKIVR